MKRYLLLLSIISLFLIGCNRWFNREDRLIGSWKLAAAEKKRAFNRNPIETGYESGVFSFYDNGQARYTEGSLRMEGNWQLRYISNGAFDTNGNYHTNSRTVLTLNLVNFQSNKVLNLAFDECRFNHRDRFIAEYETLSYQYRYIFERY